MIVNFLLSGVISIIGSVMSLLGLQTVNTLPFGMDTALNTAIGYFNSFTGAFPFLGPVFTVFGVYLGFRVTLLLLRLFRVVNFT